MGPDAEVITVQWSIASHQRWPQVLPGGEAVLYTANDAAGLNDANLVVQPLPNGERKIVHRGGFHGRYVSSGHLLYVHDAALFAVRFDLDRLEATGEPARVLNEIVSHDGTGGAQFDVSRHGTLVLRPRISFIFNFSEELRRLTATPATVRTR